MPMGCVPRGGDEFLGREFSPALHLTILLLATVGLWKLPCSPTLLPPQSFPRALRNLSSRCSSVLP